MSNRFFRILMRVVTIGGILFFTVLAVLLEIML